MVTVGGGNVVLEVALDGRRRLAAEEARGEGADFDGTLVADEVDVGFPVAAVDDGDGADGAVDRVGGGDVVPFWRPGAAAEVGS